MEGWVHCYVKLQLELVGVIVCLFGIIDKLGFHCVRQLLVGSRLLGSLLGDVV